MSLSTSPLSPRSAVSSTASYMSSEPTSPFPERVGGSASAATQAMSRASETQAIIGAFSLKQKNLRNEVTLLHASVSLTVENTNYFEMYRDSPSRSLALDNPHIEDLIDEMRVLIKANFDLIRFN
jgi:hypothetical protein